MKTKFKLIILLLIIIIFPTQVFAGFSVGYTCPASACRSSATTGYAGISSISQQSTIRSNAYAEATFDGKTSKSKRSNIVTEAIAVAEVNKTYSGTGEYSGIKWELHGTWNSESTGASGSFDDGGNCATVKIDNTGPDSCTTSKSTSCAGPDTMVIVSMYPNDPGCADPANIDGLRIPGYAKTGTGMYGAERSMYDTLGNLGSKQCVVTWSYDDTAPTCTGTSISNSNWTNTDITLRKTGCTDTGCAGGATAFTVTATCSTTYQLGVKDNVGNTKYYSYKVTNIDKKNPDCGNYSCPSDKYYRTDFPVSVGCSDSSDSCSGASGCTRGSYGGTAHNGYTTIGIGDNAGNGRSCGIDCTSVFDGTAPTITINFDEPHNCVDAKNYTRDEVITVNISATDERAGVNRICYEVTGTEPKAANCVSGSTNSFTISTEGQNDIHVWSYDNAKDWGVSYNNSTDVKNTSGNRSDLHRIAYIDRTKPNLTDYTKDDTGYVDIADVDMALTSAYDAFVDTNGTRWVSEPITVVVDAKDTEYADGSSSGISSVEYVWSLTDNPNLVWGDRNVDLAYTPDGNTDCDVPVDQPEDTVYDIHNFWNDYTKAYAATNTGTSPKNNLLLNDAIYLHVRVCDRTITTCGQKAPHCTTSVYDKSIQYDDRGPGISVITDPDEDKTPVNPPTDPDDPFGGGTGSEIVEPNKIKNNSAMDDHDWTNKLVIDVTTYECMAAGSEYDLLATCHPDDGRYAYKENSGLDRIEFYYDRNYNHETLTLNRDNFLATYDNIRTGCVGNKTCSYYLDFNSLSDFINNLQSEETTVMEEGNRFIRIRVWDVAKNYTDFYYGPYQFDITPNKNSNIEFNGAIGTIIDR